jgi:hypothetical protein
MAIYLHNFISVGKRYVQVESQPHHITGIFREITNTCENWHQNPLLSVDRVYFQCEEEGTITYYQTTSTDKAGKGIWTYLVYECSENEEKVFRDSSIDTSINLLQKLLAGQKLLHTAADIYEYLRYKLYESDFIDTHLPSDWDTPTGRKIVNLIFEEFQAFHSSSLFAEGIGKQYMKNVINKFIELGREVLNSRGKWQDFELAQYDVLKKIKIDDIANLILEHNDYRLWQAVLPSKSKAVEYAFDAALNLICRLQG